ncbi:AraC family transcriptional regulator [Oceanicola sp. S124]|uniref:AraC family transcriptional regulator n=1 Tax=Oceanicola sp. S124 TaxID=1042378 RepID=UPI000255896B|nr:AraC family transcriptional regulator [Oceanicola sp. S124]
MRTLENLSRATEALALRKHAGLRPTPTGVPGLSAMRSTAPSLLDHDLFGPVFCLVLSGAKTTRFDAGEVAFHAGQAVCISLDLPAVSQVVRASPAEPYLALGLQLDMAELRELAPQVPAGDDATPQPLASAEATPELVDAMARLLSLEDRADLALMAPLYLRELHLLLLQSPLGAMLRRLARPETEETQIARALSQLRRAPGAHLRIDDLARASGMSPSLFHRRFREITGTTPLQFHKRLRLLEARRLLQQEGHGVTQAAFEVGYESPSHFSRDYRRLFGLSPRQDLSTTGA